MSQTVSPFTKCCSNETGEAKNKTVLVDQVEFTATEEQCSPEIEHKLPVILENNSQGINKKSGCNCESNCC